MAIWFDLKNILEKKFSWFFYSFNQLANVTLKNYGANKSLFTLLFFEKNTFYDKIVVV